MSKEVRKLFLLSADEYERFKENIPHWNGWWWLRSQSEYNYNAMDVDYDGLIHEYGTFITLDYGAVRPALVIEKEVYEYEIGDFYNYSIFPMVCIGHSKKYSWFISEVPMTTDKFDDNSNDYNNSYIKNELLPKLQEKYFGKYL